MTRPSRSISAPWALRERPRPLRARHRTGELRGAARRYRAQRPARHNSILRANAGSRRRRAPATSRAVSGRAPDVASGRACRRSRTRNATEAQPSLRTAPYFPFHSGLRFCANAVTPSIMSSEREQRGDQRIGLLHRVLERQPWLSSATCLVARTDDGEHSRIALAQRSGRGAELGERDDLVDDAQAMRLGGTDRLAGQHHAHGDLRRDVLGQALHAAGERGQADARLRQAEARMSAATMMSHASAISKPPPSARPFTAARTGLNRSKRAVMPPKPPLPIAGGHAVLRRCT